MATTNDAVEAVYSAFITDWESGESPETPYVFDRERLRTEGIADWVRLVVRHNVSQQSTLGAAGSRKFTRRGTVFAQVFTPVGTGRQRADDLAERIRNIFEGTTMTGGIRLYAALIREVAPQEDDAWEQLIVEVPFEYEETK